MHCVLLGVFPDVLKLCYRSLSSEEKSVVSKLISELSCPRELIAFSRKVRSLDEIAQFKANELFNWLFYLSPVLFLNRIPNSIYDHLTNLVFGVRLLLESSSEENVSQAERFLDQFSQEIVSLHGNNERIETIKFHSLKHLPDQVRRFGPLHCQSAMSFEAANRTLGEVSSGTNSECEIICRRILQRHRLISVDIEDKKVYPLFSKLTGTVDKQFGPDEFIETKTLIQGRQFYPDAIFTKRHEHRNTYFDSPAYKRSKSGNCFVCFFYENELVFGKIQYFIKFNCPPFFGRTLANVQKFSINKDIGRVKNLFFEVQPSEEENLIPVENLQKVLCVKLTKETSSNSRETFFMIKQIDVFEHS